ncbi:MAG: ABC transporter permease [Ruminococcus sp.]|nr:ABC transporter permease [Ruminococcus sp.]
MNDEKNFASSPLDEIEYNPSTAKKDGPEGISAPVLDDFGYVAPSDKKSGPQGVSAPILDDMDSYTPAPEKKGAPQGVSAPVLDDNDEPYSAEIPEKLILSDEEIIAGLSPDQLEVFNRLPAENQKKVLDMRRAQLGAEAPAEEVKAPVLDDDNYIPLPKKEEPPKPAEPIKAPVLDDEPEPPKYVPKYVDEDLEKAKREAAKKAVSSQLTSNQKDSKESLRMMLELKEERRAEMAAKGFRISIILTFVGIIAAVAFYLLYSGQLGLSYNEGLSGISKVIENSSLYIAVIVGLCSFTLLTGIGSFKSLSSFIFMVFGVMQIFPGVIMIPQHNGNKALIVVLYAAALICTVVVFATLCGSECVGQFFKKDKNRLD